MLTNTNGEVKAVIGGKERVFKFGMLAARMIELHGQTLVTSIDQIGLILWAGLSTGKNTDLPDSFSIDDAIEWMDTISDEGLALVLATQKQAFERLPNVAVRVNQLLGLNDDGSIKATGKNSLK